jgi:hypothetical protein
LSPCWVTLQAPEDILHICPDGAVRQTLDGHAFEQAYRRGRELSYDETLPLAEETARTSPER